MIPQIRREIASRLSLSEENISYALMGTGVDRRPETYRNVLLLYENDTPRVVAKWYYNNNSRTAQENSVLEELNKLNLRVPKALGTFTVNQQTILLEEFVPGITLQQALSRKIVDEEKAVSLAARSFEALAATKQPSSLAELEKELSSILSRFQSSPEILANQSSVLSSLRDSIIEYYSTSSLASTSLVHFDFRLSNLILSDSEAAVFDFEFARRSHFAFLDWFRMWQYSPGLQPAKLFDYSLPQNLAQTLKEVDTKSTLITNLWLLFYITDFLLKSEVYPSHYQDKLASELRERTKRLISGQFSVENIVDKFYHVDETNAASGLDEHLLSYNPDELRSLVKHLSHEIKGKQTLVAQLERKVEEHAEVLSAVERSPSLKIGRLFTKPLRTLRKVVR